MWFWPFGGYYLSGKLVSLQADYQKFGLPLINSGSTFTDIGFICSAFLHFFELGLFISIHVLNHFALLHSITILFFLIFRLIFKYTLFTDLFLIILIQPTPPLLSPLFLLPYRLDLSPQQHFLSNRGRNIILPSSKHLIFIILLMLLLLFLFPFFLFFVFFYVFFE